MSYTYAGNPYASAIHEVHYRLGNTDPSNPVATDEEAAFALAESRGNTYLAAAMLAESKALEFVHRPAVVMRGDRTTQHRDQAQNFLMLAQTLRLQASIRTTTIYGGGLDAGEKQAGRADRGTVQPFARKDLHVGPPVLAPASGDSTLARED